MYKCILVPVDLADTDLAKPAIQAAVMLANIGEQYGARDQRAAADAGDAC